MDQYTMRDPRSQYPQPPFDRQRQDAPGLAKDMLPKPDHGEESYRGCDRLSGRHALVTGADSGIGRATAIAFAREGADVTLSYMPEEEEDAKEVIRLIEAAGRKAIAFPGNLSQESYCRELVERAHKEMGSLDIVAIIAGGQHVVQDITDLKTEDLEHIYATNVYAMFWICREAMKYLQPGATIINTTSIQSYQPSPHLLDYASTKAAITAFTHAFAKQAIEKGVRVNAVAPGPVWTPLQPAGGQPEENIPHFGEKSPMGRPGQPAEVAPAYVFLASQESSFVTGEIIGVTGGQHLP